MSLYATWLAIDDDNHETECAQWVRVKEGEPWDMVTSGERYYRRDYDRPCTCGEQAPIIYRGSHVNPSEDDPRGGFVMVCAIPDHCHPDAIKNPESEGFPVDFLRLSVREDPSTYKGSEPGDATIVLTKKQVTEIRDTLTQWLEADGRA